MYDFDQKLSYSLSNKHVTIVTRLSTFIFISYYNHTIFVKDRILNAVVRRVSPMHILWAQGIKNDFYLEIRQSTM